MLFHGKNLFGRILRQKWILGRGIASTSRNGFFQRKKLWNSSTQPFHAEYLRKMYRRDGIDPRKWCLIQTISKYATAVVLGFPIICTAAFLHFLDCILWQGDGYMFKSGENRTGELMSTTILALDASMCAIPAAIFFRFRQLMVFRVYQSLVNPSRYVAIKRDFFLRKRWILFDRNEAVRNNVTNSFKAGTIGTGTIKNEAVYFESKTFRDIRLYAYLFKMKMEKIKLPLVCDAVTK